MRYKSILLIGIMLLMSCIFVQADIAVPETIKIGLKYGSTAVKSVNLKNNNGFRIGTESGKQVAVLDETNIMVEKAQINNEETYLIIEKGGFLDYNSALTYTEENKNDMIYYEDNVFYAAREKIMNHTDANNLLWEIRQTNPSAYMIEPNQKRIRISDQKSGQTKLVFSEQTGENLEIASKNGGTLLIDSVEYRGSVIFIRQDASDMTVISKVSMNEYLYSVTPSEIPAGSGLEALKAQAVCARTYAVQNSGRHASMGFSLCDSQHCQVYKGVSWEKDSTTQAVNETNKQVLTYDGKIITAVYSASCGGRTEDVENVWGSPYPYLKSVEDPYCKDVSWELPLDFSTINQTLLAKGYDFGNLQSLEILERTPTGRVLKIQITGDKMTKVFEREQARTILNLKSQFYDIVPQNTFRILTASGFLYWNLGGREKLDANGITKIEGNAVTVLTVENGEVVPKTLPTVSESFVIKGEGNGHGVGMCQNGAIGLAEHGYSYEQILKHYYTGVEITTGK